MSVKAYEPTIKIHLVHDEKAISHLTEAEKQLFDSFSVADPSDYTVEGKKQYQRMKLCVNKYTPFENSLYIDVDTMWLPKKNINGLLESLMAYDFYIGKNGDFDPLTRKRTGGNYTYWGDPNKICRFFKLKNLLPQTISGVFWFKKGEYTDKIFARAQAVYNDKGAPTQKWANGKADEYCFNVALSEVNYQQQNSHIVYFDKTNGELNREVIYNNYWGIAAGGNKLSIIMRNFYNELVDLYHQGFSIDIKRPHVDKIVMISERRNY